jgi:hypothetical protein
MKRTKIANSVKAGYFKFDGQESKNSLVFIRIRQMWIKVSYCSRGRENTLEVAN